MADDLAFLFNDPVPRPVSDPTRPGSNSELRATPHRARQLPADINWMTLRQVHDQTSIPISTLRKWARKGKVRARLVRLGGRDLRLVAYEDVVDRAHTLERVIQPVEGEMMIDPRDSMEIVAEGGAPLPSAAAGEPAGMPIEPVSRVDSVSKAPSPPAGPDPAAEAPPTAPEGSILVPLDAWDRLLDQLGNLHEAGQQLAEARERAGRAETEAEFLKERVREMRKRAEEAELALDLQSEARALPEAVFASEPVLQIGWRRFRERWLGR